MFLASLRILLDNPSDVGYRIIDVTEEKAKNE